MIEISRYDDELEEEYRNIRDNYKKIIEILEEKTDYLEIVNFKFQGRESQQDTQFYNIIKDNIKSSSSVRKWAGVPVGPDDSDMFKVKTTKEIFEYLKSQKFFFRVKKGGFLFNELESKADISFYTKDNICLLYIVTEEAIVGIYDQEIEKIARQK